MNRLEPLLQLEVSLVHRSMTIGYDGVGDDSDGLMCRSKEERT